MNQEGDDSGRVMLSKEGLDSMLRRSEAARRSYQKRMSDVFARTNESESNDQTSLQVAPPLPPPSESPPDSPVSPLESSGLAHSHTKAQSIDFNSEEPVAKVTPSKKTIESSRVKGPPATHFGKRRTVILDDIADDDSSDSSKDDVQAIPETSYLKRRSIAAPISKESNWGEVSGADLSQEKTRRTLNPMLRKKVSVAIANNNDSGNEEEEAAFEQRASAYAARRSVRPSERTSESIPSVPARRTPPVIAEESSEEDGDDVKSEHASIHPQKGSGNHDREMLNATYELQSKEMVGSPEKTAFTSRSQTPSDAIIDEYEPQSTNDISVDDESLGSTFSTSNASSLSSAALNLKSRTSYAIRRSTRIEMNDSLPNDAFLKQSDAGASSAPKGSYASRRSTRQIIGTDPISASDSLKEGTVSEEMTPTLDGLASPATSGSSSRHHMSEGRTDFLEFESEIGEKLTHSPEGEHSEKSPGNATRGSYATRRSTKRIVTASPFEQSFRDAVNVPNSSEPPENPNSVIISQPRSSYLARRSRTFTGSKEGMQFDPVAREHCDANVPNISSSRSSYAARRSVKPVATKHDDPKSVSASERPSRQSYAMRRSQIPTSPASPSHTL